MAEVLVIVNGKEVERRDLSGSLTFGRGDDCDIKVADHMLSRRHCRIESAEEGWIVIDLDSKNGTLIDGKRITRQPVRDGQVVRAGGVQLRFELEARAKSLEDEVLAMLNDAAPSPSFDEAAQSFSGLDDSQTGSTDLPAAASAEPPPREMSKATPVVSATQALPARQPGRSLWEMASAATPAVAPKRSKKEPRSANLSPAVASAPSVMDRLRDRFSHLADKNSDPQDKERPWFRRRIPTPVAIGVAILVGVVLWYLVNGHDSPKPPPQPLIHRPPPRWAD